MAKQKTVNIKTKPHLSKTPAPRPEYPRPDLVRDEWLNLNGSWEFAFDDDNLGRQSGWQAGKKFERSITVPFAYQAPLSGIADRALHHVVWYRRHFQLPAPWRERRVRLNFGAVDYEATVFVNGTLAVMHQGGHTPFSADITALLQDQNELVVCVRDDESLWQPRGKQFWEEKSAGLWYTRTTGIWQSVWLEPLPQIAIAALRIDSWDLSGHVVVDVKLDAHDPFIRVRGEALLGTEIVASAEAGLLDRASGVKTAGHTVRLHLQIPSPKFWSVTQPNLYDLRLTLLQGDEVLENVSSYFGIRNLSIQGASIMLNGFGLYQKLILDQGYWPDGLLTAPSDDELKADIVRMKEMGFNGCRKHMKVEDPRFLYWADKLGYLVWGEMPACWEYSDQAVQRFTSEWQEAVLRDRNHPCVIAWTPINESWGVDERNVWARPDQIAFLDALYHLTRALDPTRPVNGNDGWQNPTTDLTTIHDYAQNAEVLLQHLQTFIAQRGLAVVFSYNFAQLLPGHAYRGQPILLTEYGGIGLAKGKEAWGYGNVASSPEELLARFEALTTAVQRVPECVGYCYTQLSDVEQEQNGLYSYERKPKLAPAKVREINERRKDV